jgi:hypothetical protein
MNDNYIKKVKRWVDLDNAIEIKKSKIKNYSDERKKLETEIVDYITDNDMQNVQINISDGYIKFPENKTLQALSMKTLKDNLEKVFKEHPQSELTPEIIYKYILDNRETKSKIVIKRHITS